MIGLGFEWATKCLHSNPVLEYAVVAVVRYVQGSREGTERVKRSSMLDAMEEMMQQIALASDSRPRREGTSAVRACYIVQTAVSDHISCKTGSGQRASS